MRVFAYLLPLCFLAGECITSLVMIAEPVPVHALDSSSQQSFFSTVWPAGPGHIISPQLPDQELTMMLKEIDPVRIQAIIEKLVSFGTRNTLSNQTDPNRGIGASRDWIANEMREIATASGGRMTVTVPSYIQEPASSIPTSTVISNIIATLRGSSDPGRVYVVSGHYDSRNTNVDNFVDDAPGADDDGSGVAVSMELARVMASHHPAATIMFAVVAGEEQGLYGSNFMAEQLKNASVDVQGMLDNDIVGSSTADDGTKDPFNIRMFVQGIPPTETSSQVTARVSVGGESDTPARELGRFVTEVASNDVTNMEGKSFLLPFTLS